MALSRGPSGAEEECLQDRMKLPTHRAGLPGNVYFITVSVLLPAYLPQAGKTGHPTDLPVVSQSISIEGIAGLGIAGLEPKLEPAHALGRAPMGKSVRDHLTLRPLLNAIIPNLAGSIQRFLDISGFKDLAALVGLTGPDS